MHLATKYSAGIKSEIPSPEEAYRGKPPVIPNVQPQSQNDRPKSSVRAGATTKDIEQNRGPYLDIMTFQSSIVSGHQIDCQREPHTRLLVEPVLIPDLTHTGIILDPLPLAETFGSATETFAGGGALGGGRGAAAAGAAAAAGSRLFYPDGRRNRALQATVRAAAALGAPRPGSNKTLRQRMTQPDLASINSPKTTTLLSANTTWRPPVEKDKRRASAELGASFHSGMVSALTPALVEEEEQRMMMEQANEVEGPGPTGIGGLDALLESTSAASTKKMIEEDSPEYGSHRRMSTHFSGHGVPMSEKDIDILSAGLSQTAKGKPPGLPNDQQKRRQKRQQRSAGLAGSKSMGALPRGAASASSTRGGGGDGGPPGSGAAVGAAGGRAVGATAAGTRERRARRGRADREARSVLGTLRQNNQWLQTLVDV